ncbi:MAG: hypothetical protein MUE81_04515 [Thermoflexibacter sp.]|jgi:hypothetical protein|nr:hypothetical protein [Thermoflexibacter sp.]
MHQTLAKVISYIFHPALIPTYVFSIIFFFAPSLISYKPEQKLMLLTMIFLLTFVLPSMSIYIYYKLNMISSLAITERKERVVPFLTISLFYLIMCHFFYTQPHIFPLMAWVMLGITLVVGLITVLTFFFKVSVHSAGVSGGIGVLLGLQYLYPNENFLYPILFFVFLTGLVASARLALNAHSYQELIAGSVIGISLTFITLYL